MNEKFPPAQRKNRDLLPPQGFSKVQNYKEI